MLIKMNLKMVLFSFICVDEDIREAFKAMDLDGDGFISLNDLYSVVVELHERTR